MTSSCRGWLVATNAQDGPAHPSHSNSSSNSSTRCPQVRFKRNNFIYGEWHKTREPSQNEVPRIGLYFRLSHSTLQWSKTGKVNKIKFANFSLIVFLLSLVLMHWKSNLKSSAGIGDSSRLEFRETHTLSIEVYRGKLKRVGNMKCEVLNMIFISWK